MGGGDLLARVLWRLWQWLLLLIALVVSFAFGFLIWTGLFNIAGPEIAGVGYLVAVIWAMVKMVKVIEPFG